VRPRSFQPREPQFRRNGKIRAREIRVIDEDKQQLGVMQLGDALRLAQSRGLDLIETVPSATPPVCRIVNYGKFQYEEGKRSKGGNQAANKTKELQLTPGIDPHDFSTKLNHALRFLEEDMRVRVKLRFRGRQRAHKEIGFEVVNRFVKETAGYGQADAPPKMLGERDLSVVISPLPKDKRAKPPKPPKPVERPAAAAEAPPVAGPETGPEES
jgi:translation initiation factor IF-3